MGKSFAFAALGLTALVLSGISSEATAQSFEGARLIGAGGAQRALTTENDSIYLNPAGLALGSVYTAEFGYQDDFRDTDRQFNASIADSQAGPVAGGVAYTYTNARPNPFAAATDHLRGHRVDLALATLVGESIAIGVDGRYLNFDRLLAGSYGNNFSIFTLDAGLAWRIGAGISIAATGYNLTNPSEAETPLGLGGGLGWALAGFNLEADARYNVQKDKWFYAGTVGYSIADTFPLRVGISRDNLTQSTSISAGAGLNYQSFGLDFGYRQQLNAEVIAGVQNPRIFAAAMRFGFM